MRKGYVVGTSGFLGYAFIAITQVLFDVYLICKARGVRVLYGDYHQTIGDKYAYICVWVNLQGIFDRLGCRSPRLVGSADPRLNPETFSIYSYERIVRCGGRNPFAWHLALESRLLFAQDGNDYLCAKGNPQPYNRCIEDCLKFKDLFEESAAALAGAGRSCVFELSVIFLAVRNIATCYSLGVTSVPTFSRRSALQLGCDSAPLSLVAYNILERARILCTRGQGDAIAVREIQPVIQEIDQVRAWMAKLVERGCHGEFNDRVAVRRRVIQLVNRKAWKNEELCGLATKAIDRWALVNSIDPASRLVALRLTARRLNSLAAKSQDRHDGL